MSHLAKVGSSFKQASDEQTSRASSSQKLNPMANLVTSGFDGPDEKWSFYSGSQSLVTVLNDPSLPRSDIFTKDWGANFSEIWPVIPLCPSVSSDWSSLESYRKRIRKREKVEVIVDTQQQNIDIIPRLFLRPDFSLENVNTFNLVISSFASSPSSSSLASSETLKESIKSISKNLTDYLDIVEDNLSVQIAKRFREFFYIMNAIDLVMDNLSKTIKQVTLLRHKCQQLQETFVKPNLQNIKLHRARGNVESVVQKMQLMSTISQTQPTIQTLLSNSNFAGSLDLITTTQEVFNQELLGLNCFRYLNSQLFEVRDIISKMMKEEFIKFINAFCNQPLNDQVNEIKFIPQSERLEALVMGMLKNGCFSFIDDFNKEARIAIKALVKQTVIEMLSQEDDIEFDGKEESSLFEKLKDIATSKWLQLLNAIFINLNLLLQKMELIQKLMKKVVQDACERRLDEVSSSNNNSNNNGNDIPINNINSSILAQNSSSSSSATSLIPNGDSNQSLIGREYNKLIITINESLVAICEDAHSFCKDLIKYKANSGSLDKLSSAKFLELSKAIESFTSECELRCGRRTFILESVLKNQANRFATRFHEERKRKLNSVLSIEPWKSLDPVPSDVQEMIDIFQNEKLSTITYTNSIRRTNKLSPQKNATSNNSLSNNHISKCYVVLNGENYVLISSMRTLLSILLEYCECCNEIPSLSMELLTRLLDLLVNFNTRANQLVLGGSATTEAGLKQINTRNLFICRRSLQLVTALLPYLESYFCDLLPSKHRSVIKHFSDVQQLYKDHTKKIPEKVLSMIRDFLSTQLSKWEAKPPVPSQPFQSVSQHFMRLHENVQDVIPDGDLLNFFNRLSDLFKEILKLQLQRLKIQNDGGPQHGLVTQEMTFYAKNLANLGIGKRIRFSIDDLWS